MVGALSGNYQESEAVGRKKERAHARTIHAAILSSIPAIFRNLSSPYHETGETASPCHNPSQSAAYRLSLSATASP